MAHNKHFKKSENFCWCDPNNNLFDNGIDNLCTKCGVVFSRSLNFEENISSRKNLSNDEIKAINTVRYNVNNVINNERYSESILNDAMFFASDVIIHNLRYDKHLKESKILNETPKPFIGKLRLKKFMYKHLTIAAICLSIRYNQSGVRFLSLIQQYCPMSTQSKACVKCRILYENMCSIYKIPYFAENKQFEPEWFVEKFTKSFDEIKTQYCKKSKINEGFEIEKKARFFLSKTKDLYRQNEGYPLAALAVYLASRVCGKMLDYKLFVEKLDIAPQTLLYLFKKVDKSESSGNSKAICQVFPEFESIKPVFVSLKSGIKRKR